MDKTIAALQGLTTTGKPSRNGTQPHVRKKRRMSAAGRAAIAKAQRERWARMRNIRAAGSGKKK
jgi:hypothetical protein